MQSQTCFYEKSKTMCSGYINKLCTLQHVYVPNTGVFQTAERAIAGAAKALGHRPIAATVRTAQGCACSNIDRVRLSHLVLVNFRARWSLFVNLLHVATKRKYTFGATALLIAVTQALTATHTLGVVAVQDAAHFMIGVRLTAQTIHHEAQVLRIALASKTFLVHI